MEGIYQSLEAGLLLGLLPVPPKTVSVSITTNFCAVISQDRVVIFNYCRFQMELEPELIDIFYVCVQGHNSIAFLKT